MHADMPAAKTHEYATANTRKRHCKYAGATAANTHAKLARLYVVRTQHIADEFAPTSATPTRQIKACFKHYSIFQTEYKYK